MEKNEREIDKVKAVDSQLLFNGAKTGIQGIILNIRAKETGIGEKRTPLRKGRLLAVDPHVAHMGVPLKEHHRLLACVATNIKKNGVIRPRKKLVMRLLGKAVHKAALHLDAMALSLVPEKGKLIPVPGRFIIGGRSGGRQIRKAGKDRFGTFMGQKGRGDLAHIHHLKHRGNIRDPVAQLATVKAEDQDRRAALHRHIDLTAHVLGVIRVAVQKEDEHSGGTDRHGDLIGIITGAFDIALRIPDAVPRPLQERGDLRHRLTAAVGVMAQKRSVFLPSFLPLPSDLDTEDTVALLLGEGIIAFHIGRGGGGYLLGGVAAGGKRQGGIKLAKGRKAMERHYRGREGTFGTALAKEDLIPQRDPAAFFVVKPHFHRLISTGDRRKGGGIQTHLVLHVSLLISVLYHDYITPPCHL